jgi:hypothetical protein
MAPVARLCSTTSVDFGDGLRWRRIDPPLQRNSIAPGLFGLGSPRCRLRRERVRAGHHGAARAPNQIGNADSREIGDAAAVAKAYR